MQLKSHISPDVFLHVPTSLMNDAANGARGNVFRAKMSEPRVDTASDAATSRNTDDVSARSSKEAVHNMSPGPQGVSLNLVFFVTGNPGLIAYYHPFLAGLVQRLEGDEGGHGTVGGADEEGSGNRGGDGKKEGGKMPGVLVVAGFSLGGFEVEDYYREEARTPQSGGKAGEIGGPGGVDGDRGMLCDLLFPPHTTSASPSPLVSGQGLRDKIYTLTDQIELCYARLENLAERLRREYCHRLHVWKRGNVASDASSGGEKDVDVETSVNVNVTLVGHSVGAYIALEMVRLRHERQHKRSKAVSPQAEATLLTPTATSRAHESSDGSRYTITSAILLTPTIQDLHLSSSGRIATPLLTYLPFLPTLAHGLVQNLLVRILPRTWFEGLVQRATGMEGGSHGVETTVAFLRSRHGVKQALEMARCELKEIREDRWGSEVWGVSHDDEDDEETYVSDIREGRGDIVRNPRLYFWFAKEDHWVADITREQILKGRGKVRIVEREDRVGLEGGRIAGHDDDSGSIGKRTPRFRIDETGGLVHAWCLAQSEIVGKRVSRWLREIMDEEYGL